MKEEDVRRWSIVDVLQNGCSSKIRKFHRKTHLLESLFNRVTVLRPCNFIKKKLQHRWFSLKFAKFLRSPFFTEHHQWLLLKNGLQRKYEISPVYMTKVTGLQRKKSEKERMTWSGECLRPRRNYKGNLDLLKRCSEKFL